MSSQRKFDFIPSEEFDLVDGNEIGRVGHSNRER